MKIQLTVDFQTGTALKYTQFSIDDLSGLPPNLTAVNPLCFDDIYAVPYDSNPAPYRKFTVTDFCGSTVTSENILLTDDNGIYITLKLEKY